MAGDELRTRYPGIFEAVRADFIPVSRDLVKAVVHWLGDYARLKQQPGQPGVPEGVAAAQRALAEAYAATSSRQREQERVDAAGLVLSGHESYVGTTDAAAELGMPTDAVRWHCRRGNLEHTKVGRQLMVSTAAIEDFKRRKAERSA